MEFLIIAALLGLIPAAIADRKGRNFFLWWLYGCAIFIVAVIHALVLKPTQAVRDYDAKLDGLRKCDSCAEFIRPDARVCRFCGRDAVAPAA